MITISDAAKVELDAYFKDNAPSSVRVFLSSGGWAGPRLALALDESKDSDIVVEDKGYTLCIDKELSNQVGNVAINFSYMGFSIDSEKPVNTGGSACGSCSVGGGCGGN